MNETIDLGKFPLGKNNIAKETSLPEGSLRDAINVDIDNSGKPRLREGYKLLYSGINTGSAVTPEDLVDIADSVWNHTQ